MFGAGGEASSLDEKNGGCHQMQICPPQKKLPERDDPVLLEGEHHGCWGQGRDPSGLCKADGAGLV